MGRSRDEALQFATLVGVKTAFKSSWINVKNTTIIVDDCGNIAELLALVQEAGGLSAEKGLILSTREVEDKKGLSLMVIPPFSVAQSEKLVRSMGASTDDVDARKLYERAHGNPLYLSQLVSSKAARFAREGDVAETLFNELPSRTRELVFVYSTIPGPSNCERPDSPSTGGRIFYRRIIRGYLASQTFGAGGCPRLCNFS